ncbi:MAG TPA: hypothetical protein PKM67_06565 [Kiritimatiellia bacterium]|nr:hypothetical protein [Kiritimatiellia bacterium]HNS81103.1 hypothetical protein [Kiritimatiellia bacterium]HPA77571.1 hypothetical protein [Kiritimatiellia bacterium]HQQ03609.1 hypothetical protein [Kiritimatiellia bacterium]
MQGTSKAGSLILAVLLLSGCATTPYHFGAVYDYHPAPPLSEHEQQIERGKPNRFLDACDWIWPGSLLGKLILWNRKVDSHQVSQETEDTLRSYLAANHLDSVKVRINQYHPGAELSRTLGNKSVGFGWRYTIGLLGWLQYTILPQRFFGGDNYNPYSNTLNIYSDIPAVTVHEGGHSKDFAEKKLKGTYAFIYVIPFVNLWHEAQASNDALSYAQETDHELQRGGYKILYPAYATYIASDISYFTSPVLSYPLMAVCVVPAHIAGRIKAHGVTDEELSPPETAAAENDTAK